MNGMPSEQFSPRIIQHFSSFFTQVQKYFISLSLFYSVSYIHFSPPLHVPLIYEKWCVYLVHISTFSESFRMGGCFFFCFFLCFIIFNFIHTEKSKCVYGCAHTMVEIVKMVKCVRAFSLFYNKVK